MIRFAVLGCGRIGRMHAHSVKARQRVDLVAVCGVKALDDAALGSVRARAATGLDR